MSFLVLQAPCCCLCSGLFMELAHSRVSMKALPPTINLHELAGGKGGKKDPMNGGRLACTLAVSWSICGVRSFTVS